MRFAVLGLLLPLVLGCAGKNVVAGDDKTKSEQLEAAVPSWCDTTCSRLQACPAAPCNCSEDLCECPTSVGNDCVSQCLDAMARFTNGRDACAIAGGHFQQCVDAVSCSDLQSEGASCTPNDADQAACPEVSSDSGSSDGSGVDPTGPNGASSPGTASGGAPSMMNPPDATGGAPVSPPVSCMGAWGTAGASSGGPPPSSAVVCEEGLDGCSDGHQYSWLCAKGSQGETACSCLVDSEVTAGFDPGGTDCPTQPQVNAGCHWNILQ